MKKDVKFRLVAFLLPVLMIIQAFFLTSVGHAKEKTSEENTVKEKYSINLDIKILEKTDKPSARQVKVWKLPEDKLAKNSSGTIDELETAKNFDKLDETKIKEALGEELLTSEESKITENGENERISIEIEQAKDEVSYYLIKESDDSYNKMKERIDSGKSEKLNTTVIKVPSDQFKEKILDIQLKGTTPIPTKDITLIKVDEDDENIKLDKVGFKLFRKDDKKNETDPDTYSLVPVKKQETGAYYEYDPSNAKGDNILRTNTDGKIVVKGLPEGDYYFEEVETIEGYDPQFNIGRNNKDKPIKLGGSVTITNKRIPSLIKYVKDTDTFLDGVTFAVYKKGSEEKLNFKEGKNSGEYIYVETKGITDIETKSGGKIYLREMPKGEYYFKEITAKKGYKKSEDSYEFSVDENHKILVKGKVDSVQVPNTPENPNPTPKNPEGSHKFIKVDESDHDKKLADAKFKVQKLVDGKFMTVVRNGQEYNVSSDSNGLIEVSDLEYGHYRLKETVAPDGYILSSEFTEFDIDAKSSLNTPIFIENKKPPKPPKEETPPPTPVTPPSNPPTPVTPTKTIASRSRGPMVKTGDIRIWIYFAIGLVMIIAGSIIVRSQDKKQQLA